MKDRKFEDMIPEFESNMKVRYNKTDISLYGVKINGHIIGLKKLVTKFKKTFC